MRPAERPPSCPTPALGADSTRQRPSDERQRRGLRSHQSPCPPEQRRLAQRQLDHRQSTASMHGRGLDRHAHLATQRRQGTMTSRVRPAIHRRCTAQRSRPTSRSPQVPCPRARNTPGTAPHGRASVVLRRPARVQPTWRATIRHAQEARRSRLRGSAAQTPIRSPRAAETAHMPPRGCPPPGCTSER